MKKICLVVTMLMFISLCGCKKEQKEGASSSSGDLSSTTAQNNSSEVVAPVNNDDGRDVADSMAEKFVTALKNGDTKTLNSMVESTDPKEFDFLKNVVISNSQVAYKGLNINSHEYFVNLIVKESDYPALKVGDNYWKLSIDTNYDKCIVLFVPDGFKISDSKYIDVDAQINACKHVELINDYLSMDLSKDDLANDFYKTCVSYYFLNTNKQTNITADEVNKFIKARFSVSSFDIKNSKYYNKDNGFVEAWNGGGRFFISHVVSSTKISDKEYEIVINYYADNIYLNVARTVKYVVTSKPYVIDVVKSRNVTFESNNKIVTYIS